ncbi:DUF1433 domain-containing protein [Bacillus pumilus]|uniref:Secreted lipoprotein n=1 Tax=Bacillus pumilus (strain SAFR-032) TaxID=315750 RepID=A8FJ32_BACP2|nr:DUF1433 domain-containing protein [Bacillus pumilus]ABV64249.1 secreted lipoprotein [Bacillus pumilus SAFR-032]MBC3644021.1 DUF1433 domain-containing protein [Bacillus pumilus]MBC3647359.1 DUF1433 domain-containing protein [Bacillus pumilus]MBC3650976.1 DUF1433 domain-containing protein [Bacillus pumilus]MBC3654541.1 DUF1433 domain-containing protein [Bacillus pumilus]
MRNTLKFSIIIVATVISITMFVVEFIHQGFSDEVVKEKSDIEKAEEFAEKMKPKIEERLHEEDIHNFIKTITFKKNVSISPMGYVTVDGYINNEPDKYHFSASLIYKSNEIGSMSHSPDLSDRFIDWDEYKDEPKVKEDYLKSFTEKEREQYLKDIGEKE